MKREECKIGTIVKTPSDLIGKISRDDGTDSLPIKVESLIGNCIEYWNPEDLTEVDNIQTRKFKTGDKVRYVPRGRENYCNEPNENKTYEVSKGETDTGWVDLKGHGYSNCVKWFDLELVEPVVEQPYYVNTGGVIRRNDSVVVICFSYSKFGKEKADTLA